MKKLTRQEMNNVQGGRVALTCTCSGPFGSSFQFQYANGAPEQWVIDADIHDFCSSGSATCIYSQTWVEP